MTSGEDNDGKQEGREDPQVCVSKLSEAFAGMDIKPELDALDDADLDVFARLDRLESKFDEDIFKLPPPKEVCPLCLLPLPIDSIRMTEMNYYHCCLEFLCDGCSMKHLAVSARKHHRRYAKNQRQPKHEPTCPFCRGNPTESRDVEEILNLCRKKMDADDARATYFMGYAHRFGWLGLPSDENKAIELILRAVELGCVEACHHLVDIYLDKNIDVVIKCSIIGAKMGDVKCRYNLGVCEKDFGRCETAVKHWLISAAGGHEASLHELREFYQKKILTKLQFEQALRSYQKATEEMSSDLRTVAKKLNDAGMDFSVLSEDELNLLRGIRTKKR